MAIKGRGEDSEEDQWKGAWGSISVSEGSVETLRLCRTNAENKAHWISFPYRVFIRWDWYEKNPEQINLWAGSFKVEIAGFGLERIVDALDHGQLEKLCEQGDNRGDASLFICSIRVEETRLT